MSHFTFRKAMAWVLCLALLLGGGTSLAATRDTILRVSDNLPPVIATITIVENGQTLKPGDTVHIQAQVEDNTIINDVHGWLRIPKTNGNGGYAWYDMEYNPETDLYEGTYTFKATDPNGVYLFDEISAQDQYGNYRVLGGSRYGSVTLAGGSAAASQDTRLQELTFVPNGATLEYNKGFVNFRAKLTIEPSDLLDVWISLAHVDADGYQDRDGRSYSADFNPDTGYWEGSASLDFPVSGRYELQGVEIHYLDNESNDAYEYIQATNHSWFNLIGAPDDFVEPVITSVSFPESGKTLGPGDTLHLYVTTDDPTSTWGQAYFRGPQTNDVPGDYIEYHDVTSIGKEFWISLEYNDTTKQLEGSYTLEAEVPNTTYHLDYLFTTDPSDNYGYYYDENLSFTFNGPDFPSDKIIAFVERAYRIIFNREVDPSGKETWGNLLASGGSTAADFINLLLSSDEYRNKNHTSAQTVEVLYQAMLGREADAGGKAAWAQALDQTGSIGTVINGFSGSVEFRKICHPYGLKPGRVAETPSTTPPPAGSAREKIEAFVKRCYELILNRAADEGGLKGWSDALESKQAAAARIIEGFVASQEYTNRKLSNEQSVDILYKTMLGREADAAGKAGWVDALSKGYTFQHIINGFCGSAEFTAICNEYGIEPGSVAIPQAAAFIVPEDILEEAKKLPDERIGAAVSADENGAAVVGYEKDEVEAFVKHAYAAALGRNADEAGLSSWTEQIMTGSVSPKAFLKSLLASDEFAARGLGDEAFVETLYALYLNRGADAAAAARVAALAAGGDRSALIAEFEASVEFRVVLARFGL